MMHKQKPLYKIGVTTAAQLHTVFDFFLVNPQWDYAILLDAFLPEKMQDKDWEAVSVAIAHGVPLFYVMPSVGRKDTLVYAKKSIDLIKNALDHNHIPKNKIHNISNVPILDDADAATSTNPAPSLSGIYCGSLDTLAFILKEYPAIPVYGDFMLYACNQAAWGFLQSYDVTGQVLPLELNHHEKREVVETTAASCFEEMIYTHIPFMQSASCIKKTKGRCNQVEETVYLTDRYGKRLPVATHCSICENTIYNGTPLSLHGYLRQERKWVTNTFHLRFTLEDEKRVNQLLCLFFLGEEIPHYDFTKGHEVKSVE